MKKIVITFVVSVIVLAGYGQTNGAHTIDSLKNIISSQPGNLPALRQYISLAGYTSDSVSAQFDEWMKQYPKVPAIPYAMAEAYYNAKDKNSMRYIIKALQAGDTSKRLQQMWEVVSGGNWQLDIPRTANTIDSLKNVIEHNPDSTMPLQQYVFLLGKDNDTAIAQVNKWIDRFPKNVNMPLMLGQSYYDLESPKAKPYLLKVVALQPNNAKAYLMLSIDAERWGKNDEAQDYMGKAAAADPKEPSYAFYYADGFSKTDTAMWHKKIWELTKNFPNSERGAQGLYWMAERSTDLKEKIAVGEQLRKLYPPDKFNWSSSGMTTLFDAYLQQGFTDKAIDLATDIGDDFKPRLQLAKNIQVVNQLIAQKNYTAAEAKLSEIKAPRYSDIANMVALFKSSVRDQAGNTQMAYDSLLPVQAKTPGDDILAALNKYGKKLNKTTDDVEKDVWAQRDKSTKAAPGFNLETYTADAKGNLENYRGKVVLLTFWFPGCGPCRGEMPHFENVLKKYNKADIAYVGINVDPTQDEYVLPFMKGTKFSFTPLRATGKWAEDVYKVRGEPINFLIDRDGKIVFQDFMINSNNERMLELMISDMLTKKG